MSESVARDMRRPVLERGRQYFLEHRVTIMTAASNLWTAHVRGSHTYEVAINLNRNSYEVSCSCRFSADIGPCKHMYASVLALEAKGYLPEVKGETGQPARRPDWERRLDEIERDLRPVGFGPEWPARRQILYLVESFTDESSLILKLRARDRNARGTGWNQEKDLTFQASDVNRLIDENDRRILAMLAGSSSYWSYAHSVGPSCRIQGALLAELAPLLCRTGRFFLATHRGEEGLRWDEGEPWQFELRVERSRGSAILEGWFRRGNEQMDVQEPSLLAPGVLFTRTHVSRLAHDVPVAWIRRLRIQGAIAAPEEDMDRFVGRLLVLPRAPRLKLPADTAIRTIESPPAPILQIELAATSASHLAAVILFDYEGMRIASTDPDATRFFAEQRTLIRRDPEREREFISDAEKAGLSGGRLKIRALPAVVTALTANGWLVEAEGRLFRNARFSKWSVSTGIDWFELEGSIDFGTSAAEMPDILLAARKGEHYVRLGDGSIGILPQEWLERFGYFAKLGELQDGKVRFQRNQALLLDAMLAAQEHVNIDQTFLHIRQELQSFEGIRAAEQPGGFSGTLRDYQREGLGWMNFLARFGLGGCLADDMGVGKTAQVLARLELRRTEGHGPSLAVVPRSLIFNWKQEATRFTPALRVLDHTGSDRSVQEFEKHDLVLTTYGTLRRDIEAMREVQFDYAILDEAQAVRNAATDAAKAVRLLKARHRLALTGTPVENRLNDLWSIFEFLNPGMLGSGRAFDALAASTRADTESESRAVLGKVLRPFILRRTKHQVARELPEKTEQTIYCELEREQRKLYNEIRDHYRASLLRGKNDDELRQSKIQVLEALLRLRQAACHPGLIDNRRSGEPSAKLESLLASLTELAAEGNKALVFSQFTSLLSIVRNRLDQGKIPYEYLDGRTRNRQTCVERFQNDPGCPLFLISLKAGGLGLNLTAAEYVFLLDPWWNPAVEQQAIDRAHRIGQTKPVVAYRLIAKDTVEEKVQELQKMKRDLVKALIGDENRLIAELRRDDLELLLS